VLGLVLLPVSEAVWISGVLALQLLLNWKHTQLPGSLCRKRERFDKVGAFSCTFFLPFIGRGSKALNKQLRKRPIVY